MASAQTFTDVTVAPGWTTSLKFSLAPTVEGGITQLVAKSTPVTPLSVLSPTGVPAAMVPVSAAGASGGWGGGGTTFLTLPEKTWSPATWTFSW